MVVDESVTVKGSPIKSLLKFIDTDLSAEQRKRAFAALPPEYAKRLQTSILATETVPVTMLNRLTEESAKAKGESLESFARRAGRAGASDAVSGIYRWLVMVLTPPALLNKAAQMWSSLYSRGQLVVEKQSESGAHLKLLNFPSEPAGCARVSGWMEKMAEMTGVKNVKVVQVHCFARGHSACEWDLTWGK